MNLEKVKILIILSLSVVALFLNNLWLYLILNLLILLLFSTKERNKLSYLRKPKFLLSIALITTTPLFFAYLQANNFFETVLLVAKMLMRAFLVLQLMGILFNKIKTDRIVHFLSKKFPNFEENLNSTIEVMALFKQTLYENKSNFLNKLFWKKFVKKPGTSLKNLFIRAWDVYSKNENVKN